MYILHIFALFTTYLIFSANFCFAEYSVKLISKKINTSLDEYAPQLNLFSKTLLFSSNRYLEIYKEDSFNLWESSFLANETILSPKNIPFPVSTKYYEGAASTRIDENGNLDLYYTYSQEQFTDPNRKDTDIYVSKFINNQWKKPVPLTVINSRFHDRMPAISQDQSRIYFSSDRPGGVGSDDIWVSYYNQEAEQWDAPQVLNSPINSIYSDISPYVLPNTRQIFWSSNRPGGKGKYDIYTAYIKDLSDLETDNWTNLLLLDKPVNSISNDETPFFDIQRQILLFASDRVGGFGGYDLYQATIPQKIYNTFEAYIHGNIYSHETKKPIIANITVFDKGQNQIISLQTSQTEGFYSLLLQKNTSYKMIITAPRHLTKKILIDLSKVNLQTDVKKDIILYKKFYVPKYLYIEYSIYNSKKQKITPSSLNQSALQIISSEDFSHDFKNGNFSFKLPNHLQHKEDFIQFIQQNTFSIEINYQKHEKFHKEYTISSLFDEPYNIDRVTLKIELKSLEPSSLNSKIFEEATFLEKIHFPLGEFRTYYTPELLVQVANRINNIKNTTSENLMIFIHGHTDDVGNTTSNQILSKNRASFIMQELIRLGVDSNLMKIYWYGNSKPLIRTGNKSVPENRRVEILLLEKQTTRDEVSLP